MGPVWPALSRIDARPKTPLVAAMVAPETAKYLRSRRKDRHVIFHLRSTGYRDSSAIRTATFASSSAIRTLRASLAIAFSIFPLLSPRRSRNEIAAAKLGDGLQ